MNKAPNSLEGGLLVGAPRQNCPMEPHGERKAGAREPVTRQRAPPTHWEGEAEERGPFAGGAQLQATPGWALHVYRSPCRGPALAVRWIVSPQPSTSSPGVVWCLGACSRQAWVLLQWPMCRRLGPWAGTRALMLPGKLRDERVSSGAFLYSPTCPFLCPWRPGVCVLVERGRRL